MIRMREYCELSIVLDHLVTEQHLLNHLIVGSLVLEEMIIHFTASPWVHPNHVPSPVILCNRFSDVFFVLEVGRFFHGLEEGRVLDRVLVHEPLYVALHLVTLLPRIDVMAHPVRGNTRALYSAS